MSGVLEFRIHGKECSDEGAMLRKELASLIPEDRLSFDVRRGKMVVGLGMPEVSSDGIVGSVAATGMRAMPTGDVEPETARTGAWEREGRTILTAVRASATASAFGIHVAVSGFAAALGSEGTLAGYGALWAAIAAIWASRSW